jgi:hypothetical protein
MSSTKKVGVSLRLKAVQVIDLVEFGTSAASVFDEEEGYEAPSASAVVSEAPFDMGDVADGADF